jgi:hypothetical protein
VVGLSLHTLRAIDESRFSAILSLLTLVFPALIWFELELLFADAIGFAWPPVLALRAALFAILLLPAFAWRNSSMPG